MTDTAALTRPIVGINNRTPQEVFDIMCDRLRASPAPDRVSDVMVGRAWEAFEAKAGYSKPERFRAALEAALSEASK